MKAPHLLRVEEGPERYAPIVEAARAAGLRVGWLDLQKLEAAPSDLERAAQAGVLRAVAVGEGRSLALKLLRGAPVLRDLLREHFRGCALVLVRGGAETVAEFPQLRPPSSDPAGETWRVEVAGQAARIYSTEALIAELRRPHPWGVRGALPP